MATYGYDRENAEKAFEYMKYKRANYTLGKSRGVPPRCVEIVES